MRQYTEIHTTLEMRRKVAPNSWQSWCKPFDEIFRPAALLAYRGRTTEAIEEAERIQVETYGDMYAVEFRCVTKATTITANAPLEDGWDTIR